MEAESAVMGVRGRVWVIRVRKHDTLVPGRICRDCFCLCVCVSVSELDDGQGCVPKLLLSDLNAAKHPDKPVFPCIFPPLFLGKAGKDDKPKPPHSHSLTLSPCQSEGYFRYW